MVTYIVIVKPIQTIPTRKGVGFMQNIAYQRVFDQFKHITRTGKNIKTAVGNNSTNKIIKIKKTPNGYKLKKLSRVL